VAGRAQPAVSLRDAAASLEVALTARDGTTARPAHRILQEQKHG